MKVFAVYKVHKVSYIITVWISKKHPKTPEKEGGRDGKRVRQVVSGMFPLSG